MGEKILFFFRNKISSELLILLGNTKNHIMPTDRLKLTQLGDNSPNRNPTEIKIILFKKKIRASQEAGYSRKTPWEGCVRAAEKSLEFTVHAAAL